MPPSPLWLPLLAIAAHLFEEFVWPGGFAQWYRTYPPGYSASVSVRFLVAVGIAMLLRLQLVCVVTVIQAVLIAGAYSVWSTWRRRHAMVRSPDETATKAPRP